ncbi:flocculation protein FLO11 isoform X2 [Acyrthosiphon pisum]|uniref:chitinase n=1 Tax=Acyrthosiphon pisum TaxID=7029 RepID=A0A8R2NQM8_ACYPI|nr:flocculation protein FLO11 isoform X2 [Acyrthosiphon pisum]
MQFLPWLLIFGSIIISDAEHDIQKRESSNQKKVVCYYTNWSVYRPGTAKFSPQNINPYLCTHLIYAFGGLDKENGLRPYDKYQDIEQGGYAKFNGLKTYNKNLKTLLAIGGWNEGSARFSKLVDDEDKRKEFVKNVIKFLRQNNFDGLDLDWEYPAYRDGSKPSDKENYASLVKELREEFNRESSKTGRSRLLLTMAVPAGIEYIDKGYDIPELNKHLDFMNLLTYDYHSSFEPAVNHHSPLYPLEEDSEYNFDAKLNIDHTIKHYLASGADKEKLVLGIPTYGRSYTLFNRESKDIGAPSDGPGEKGEATREKGYLAYYEICGNLKKDDSWTIEQPKPKAMGPYAYKDNQWVGYDDEEFVKLKAKYVNENDLGGIMFWSIDNDDFRGSCHSRPYPLIEAGKEALLGDSKVAPSQGKETKTTLSKSRPKPRPVARTTTTSAPQEKSDVSTTTPEPPTTPDTGTDFTCKDEGFFPHPRECKKYFWCLDSGPSNLGIVAHQFTCPSGLVFNKISDSCDYTRNVVCKDKKTSDTTTTTTTTTTTPKPIKSGIKTTTTTTTTSTTQTPEVEDDSEDEFEEEEDPKEIKQLITLIKKLGGVAELEKQLNIKDGSTEVTTPAISKSLYNKVLKLPPNRFQSSYINGPGPQSEGLDKKDDSIDYKKDKPQYVTIRRQRPSKDVVDNIKESEEEDIPTDATTERFKPTYKTVDRTRFRDLGEVADENSESDSLPKYTTISRTKSSESNPEETTSPKYVTLRRQRPTNKEDEISDEEITPVAVSSTSQAPRYVSLLRQRSTTTTTTPDDRLIETTTKDNVEEPRENKNTKVSQMTLTTESSIISTILFNTEPFTETIATTVYVPTFTTAKNSETSKILTLITEKMSDTSSTAKAPVSIDSTINNSISTTKAPTSTVTNVVTSIYEAATERQRVRVKNIQNFLLEHKKTEPVTQSVTHTTTPLTTTLSTTMENIAPVEEPTQKSILKGRFGGPVHFRPTLRKLIGIPENNGTTTEKFIEATTEKIVESTTEKKNRLNKYTNRFIRPASNFSTENISTTSKIFVTSTTESTSESSTRQINRFRQTTSSATDKQLPLTRKFVARYRQRTTELPVINNTEVQEVQRSRFFRSRRPISSTTTTTEETITELLNVEENADNVRYETTPYTPTTMHVPTTNVEEISTNDEEIKKTTIDSFEPIKYSTTEITTIIQPITNKITKSFRGSVRANDGFQDSNIDKSRSPSLGRQNSRFLKEEQKILFIRVMPSPDGRSQNEFTSNPVKNITRNRGRVRAYDSLELNTLTDELTNEDRPNELFRGSETKFRPTTTSTTTESTEEIQKDRIRQRITRPVQRSTTTTTTTEESPPSSSATESYSSKVNRRRKFRPEYTTTSTSSYEEEITTQKTRNPERRFRSRTPLLKNTITTSTTPETLEDSDREFFSTSSQPYFDDSSLFAKTRDDRKIGGSTEDLANTAVVAIHTLATAPPSDYEFRPSTHSPQQSVFRETTQNREYFEPQAPHSIDSFDVVQPARLPEQSLRQSAQPQLPPPPPPSIKLPAVSFQPAPFQPSPFQAGPFQPVPYPGLPFQANNAFAPVARQSPTTALPPATSRQTFILRRGPSRTTPLGTAATSAPPQYLNDNTQEQYADYSEPEQASDSSEQRVALKGKVRIHGDGYIECLDMGSFPHPFSCQKFISCAKTEYGALFGWEYTCPKGLSFDQVGGICNWSSGPVCNN